MIVGESRVINMLLRMLGQDIIDQIDSYVNNICDRDFMVLKTIDQVKNVFGESIDTFLSSLSEAEFMDLRSYTGYNYRNINAMLRGNWKYDVNGALTQEKIEEFKKISYIISNILNKFSIPKIDFITFRGATLTSFSSYGITDINQLKSLEGKFLYEQGFTSTSILEDACYFNKDLDNGKNYNVEIKYLISSECNDGALLIDDSTSYSTNQNEFLLNSGALSKVIDVKIDENANTAILTVILIPKKVYDLNYNKGINSSKIDR